MRRSPAMTTSSRGFPWRQSRHRGSRFAFLHDGLRAGLAENSDQLKNMVEPPVPQSLISVMLHNIVAANQLLCGILNARHKLGLKLSFSDSAGDLLHQHQDLRQGGLLSLHLKNKLLDKGPQAGAKKFFHHIATTDQRGCLNESHNISVFRATRRRNLRQIVHLSHFRAQRIGSFASRIGFLLRKYPAVKLVTIPATSPFIPHHRGKPRTVPKP
jgi:hypothetical protein